MKNARAEDGGTGGEKRPKRAKTSDNVDNFVEKRVEKRGIFVDEMWKSAENGDSQKKKRGKSRRRTKQFRKTTLVVLTT